MSRGKMLLFAVPAVLLLGGACALWLGWGTMRAWYVIAGLKKADDDSRAAWVERAVALGPAGVDGLLRGLEGDGGENCAEALTAMVADWGGDERAARLAGQAAGVCPGLSPEGRGRALRVLAGCCGAGDGARDACVRLLEEACGERDPAALEGALVLACRLLPETGQALPAAKRLARAGLASGSESARVQAIPLCVRPGIDLTDEVVGLMKTGTPAVRRAAVLAAGTAEGTREETLLGCLHDEDAEVRRLAHSTLQGRGLRPEQIELGRLLTHARPHSRLLVLDKLREVNDVDPVTWVTRLSQDPSPAVRTAAVRVISEHLSSEMSERLEQMARTDPSPTVAQLARYYLASRPVAVPVGGRR